MQPLAWGPGPSQLIVGCYPPAVTTQAYKHMKGEVLLILLTVIQLISDGNAAATKVTGFVAGVEQPAAGDLTQGARGGSTQAEGT